MGVARSLRSIHNLGIVHGHLQSVCPPHSMCLCHSIYVYFVCQVNILVDKDGTARIAGLGNATILPHPMAEAGRSARANDVYAIGVIAYEV